MDRPAYPIPDVEILTREELLRRYPDEHTADKFNTMPFRSYNRFIVKVDVPLEVVDGVAKSMFVTITPLS